MIKVSVMYPYKPDARFDHRYYRKNHMPMVKRLMGDACAYYTVDQGLDGGEPESTPPFIAMCHIFSESLEAFQASMASHGKQIADDVRTYTDIEPVVQISQVVVDDRAE
jgi:uncharacterized protein (TIGR02118 family)